MNPVRVLIIEDDPHCVQTLRSRLEKLGHEVAATTPSIKKALTVPGKHSIDIAILHVDSPRIQHVRSSIRMMQSRYPVPCIIITDSPLPADPSQLSAGYPHLIHIPFTDLELKGAILAVSNQHRLESEIREKQAVRSAYESEKYFILDSLSEYVVFLDPDSKIEWLNQSAAESAGESREALIGRYCYEIWHQRKRRCPECPVQLAFQTGRIQEHHVTTKSGRKWHLRAHPVRDGNGKVTGVMEFFSEITDQMQVREALLQSEMKFRLLSEHSPNLILILDENMDITWTNPAFQKSFPASRYLNSFLKTPLRHVHHDDKEKAIVRFTALLKRGTPVHNTEFRCSISNHNYQVFEVSAFRVMSGMECLIYIIARNITERKMTEQALQQSEMQYRTTLDLMGDAIHIVDREMRLVMFNRKFYEWNHLLGLNTDVLGKKLFDVFPFLNQSIQHEYDKVVKTGKPFHTRKEMNRIGANEIITETHKIPVVSDNQVHQIITVIRDITEQYRAETALRQSEEKYRSLIESYLNPIYLIDENLVYLFANQAYLARFKGKDKNQSILGKQYDRFHSQQNTEIFRSRITNVFTSGKAERYEYTSDRDGRIFLRTLSPVKDPVNKQTMAVTVVSTDITELRHAEHALKDREERYRLLFNTSNDSIFVYRLKKDGRPGVFVEANNTACYKLGYRRNELLKMTLADIQPAGQEIILPPLKKRRFLYETVHITKNGHQFPVEINGHTFHFHGESLALIIARDITERKLSEEHIQKDLLEKEILLKEIHHRVKNNLQVVCSLLSLQSKQVRDPEAQKCFQESQNRVRSMAMIHEYLYQSLNLARLNFSNYVEDLAQSLYRSYSADPDRIKLNIRVEDVELAIDTAVPCGLILNELISNALKYAFPSSFKKKGRIKIELKKQAPDEVQFVVQDNGAGLPKSIDIKKTESLGLHLVYLLVKEQLNGSLRLERRNGTKFVFQFKPS